MLFLEAKEAKSSLEVKLCGTNVPRLPLPPHFSLRVKAGENQVERNEKEEDSEVSENWLHCEE